MRSRFRSNIKHPALFFVTTKFINWQPLLQSDVMKDNFESMLFSFIETHADALMGYVIMPEHIHLMVGCNGGGTQLSKFMQALKSVSNRRLFNGAGSVWEPRFDDLLMTTEKQYLINLNYIHNNPVKRGFVDEATKWKWSSAGFWESDDEHPVLTKDFDWMEAR